jgi:hypothetical protein
VGNDRHRPETGHKEDTTMDRTMLRSTATALLVAALCAFAPGCVEEGVDPDNISEALDYRFVRVSQTTAAIGDEIEVSWSYAGETRLATQSIELLSLGAVGAETRFRQLPRATRRRVFRFGGPVTVVLRATDRRGGEINAAFDVGMDTTYAFRMTGVLTTDPDYPRLGQRTVSYVETASGLIPRHDQNDIDLDFPYFLGIYEVPQLDANGGPVTDAFGEPIEDGLINALQTPELAEAMPSRESFFGRSFDPDEVDRFRFRIGSSFPFLAADAPVRLAFPGQYDKADIVVFAGKIAYDGEETRPARANVTFRKNATYFDTIFACIDVRTAPHPNTGEPGFPWVSDMHLGNAAQGLVLSVFHGNVLDRTLGTVTAPTYAVESYGAVGEIAGEIKGSLLGFPVTKANGDFIVPAAYAGVDGTSWLVPFYPDTDLGAVQ